MVHPTPTGMRMVQKRMLLFGAYFALLHSMGTPYRKQAKSATNRSILCLQLPNGSPDFKARIRTGKL